MAIQWVQHISGQGEKWEVENSEHNYPHLWRVKDHQDKNPQSNSCAWLPKSEYRLCDPPEQWEEVTGKCGVFRWSWGKHHPDHNDDGAFYISHSYTVVNDRCYRIRKVQLRTLDSDPVLGHQLVWAFIVERRKS